MTQPPNCDVDILIASSWAGSRSPLNDAVLRLRRIEQSGQPTGMEFVVRVLDLWIKAEAPVNGWKTAGKHCPEQIIKPVIAWWLTGEPLKVHDKYKRPAEALAGKLEELSWVMFGDIQLVAR